MFKNEKKQLQVRKQGHFLHVRKYYKASCEKKGSSHLHQSLLSNKEKLRRLCKNDIVEFVLNLIENACLLFLFQTVQS